MPQPDMPRTGPEAIAAKLASLDLESLESEQREIIRSKKKTARPRAIKILNILEGLKRNKIGPEAFMISKVPVIPPNFRPFSMQGDAFVPGDSNELYRNALQMSDVYKTSEANFGREKASDAYLQLYDAVKALYGFGDSPDPKVRARKVNGFFRHVTGVNGPKHSFIQKKLLSKTQDFTGRGVLTFDADLGVNEISMPDDMAWKTFQPHVHRRLVRGGMRGSDAIKAIKNRTESAAKALDSEMEARPVVYTRAPSWHRFNTVGAFSKRHKGSDIRINVFTAEGLAGDADGDQLNVHVPVSEDSIETIKEKLMPDKMVHSVKNFDKIYATPKHEQVLGLYVSKLGAPRASHVFKDREEFRSAHKAGLVDPSDAVEIASESSIPTPEVT